MAARLRMKTIIRIAQKHNATPAKPILSRAMALGCWVIPSSTKRQNLHSNLLTLDANDMKAIAALERNKRLVSPDGLAPEGD